MSSNSGSSPADEQKVAKAEKNRQAWASTRAEGKLRYVLVHGIAGFGLLNGMLYLIIMAVVRNLEHGLPLHHGHGFSSFSLTEALVNILVFALVAGLIWGLAMWRVNDHMYRPDEAGE